MATGSTCALAVSLFSFFIELKCLSSDDYFNISRNISGSKLRSETGYNT
jgi:hypothetical protein